MKNLDPDWIRISTGVQLKMLDPEPYQIIEYGSETLIFSGDGQRRDNLIKNRRGRGIFNKEGRRRFIFAWKDGATIYM